MRVLLPIIYHQLTHCIERAFVEAGHEVKVVDWRKAKHRRQSPEDMCIREARNFRPDFAFCQFQTQGIITAAFPQTLKELGCFAVNWAGDVRNPLPRWYVDMAEHFAVTSFSNMTDVEEMRSHGHRSEFLQVGYDEHLYNVTGAEERRGVVFIGNNYEGDRFPESASRRALVHAMKEAFGDQFSVYGTKWSGGMYVAEPDDAKVLRGALVAVNWDHFHRPWFASDRLIRGTACGCAMVSQWYEGIEIEHPHVVGVKTIEEAVAAVRLLLEHPDKARQLGALSAANTLQKHRWNNRVKHMTTWLS